MTEIPPRRVLNSVLRRGAYDAGMSGGCLWPPFELDEAEYQELVRELQRRGTRPVVGRDPGGKPFATPDVPDSVGTYREWVAYLSEQRTSKSSPLLRRAEKVVPSSREAWLERLPVADLYLGYLTALDKEWRAAGDDAFDLPAELVSNLRELAEVLDEWRYQRPRRQAEELEWLRAWSPRAARIRDEARACVDRFGLPRWPYDRFGV